MNKLLFVRVFLQSWKGSFRVWRHCSKTNVLTKPPRLSLAYSSWKSYMPSSLSAKPPTADGRAIWSPELKILAMAMHHLQRLGKVSRALRIPELAETNVAWPAWTSQLLSAYQQRDHILTARVSDKPPAFVFDIDGVLIRGNKVLEPAKVALHRLYRHEGQTPRYPICFLTNGGGVTEQQKADELSSWLGVQVRADQVVLSHTPFKSLVSQAGAGPVMVAGIGSVIHVARHYGFKHILTPLDVARAVPSAVPFWKDQAGSEAESTAASGRCPVNDLGYGSPERPIETILVFKDPSDWYMDLQIMLDICVGGGILGEWSPEGNPRRVKVYFSNPDLLWASEHPAPRLGQGGFATALKALFKEVTGKTLYHEFFGKPGPAPYELAEDLLYDQAVALGLVDHQQHLADVDASTSANVNQSQHSRHSGAEGVSPAAELRRFSTDRGGGSAEAFGAIYAVGDNPKADTAGALEAQRRGRPYVSMLVRTGVFQSGKMNDEEFPADVVVDDVDAAVQSALHRTRSMRWHSMR